VAATSDYYEVLGVSRDASADDIRKAYRKLARQFHPDVNGGDTAATERFREVNKAYEALSDPEKRARYDRYGTAEETGAGQGFGGFGGGAAGPFGDIFDAFFGAAGRGAAPQAGPEAGSDLRYDLEITLEEILKGADKTIQVARLATCEECSGSGAKPGTQPQPCVVCAGAGYVRTARNTIFGTMSQVAECYRCHGRGQIITDPCSRCGGDGRHQQTRQLDVHIPPGATDGNRIRLSREGEAGPNGGPNGDLYVFLHVKQHPVFRRQGRDLMNEVDVSFPCAALGGDATTPTLEGTETVHIPAGTQSGDVFRLRGKGLPELNRPQNRGDQHVVIRVKTPRNLNDRQRQALRDFAEASGDSLTCSDSARKPERGIFEWVRNLFGAREDDPE
jgi:molecular chaperone DnaJ